MLNYINHNATKPITTYVALQHRGSAPAPVQKLKWKTLMVRQWAINASQKICWSAPTL
jgi:hypothetical protein